MSFYMQVALWATHYGRKCPTLVTQSGGHWWSNAGQQNHLSGQTLQRSRTGCAPWQCHRKYNTKRPSVCRSYSGAAAVKLAGYIRGPVCHPPHICLGSVHTLHLFVYVIKSYPPVCLQKCRNGRSRCLFIHSYRFGQRGAFNKLLGLVSVIGESPILLFLFSFSSSFSPFSG